MQLKAVIGPHEETESKEHPESVLQKEGALDQEATVVNNNTVVTIDKGIIGKTDKEVDL